MKIILFSILLKYKLKKTDGPTFNKINQVLISEIKQNPYINQWNLQKLFLFNGE